MLRITQAQLKKYIEHPLTLPVGGFLSGAVFSLGLSAYALPFALLPIIALFFQLFQGNKTLSYIKKLTLFFVPFHGTVLYWFFQSTIDNLTALTPLSLKIVALISWFLMTIVLSAAVIGTFALLAWLRAHYSKKESWHIWIVLPAFFVVAEWARSIAFSLFLYGPQGTIGDNWNFGSFGLAVMNTTFTDMASVVGMYGMTALVILVSLSMYFCMFHKSLRYLMYTGVLVCMVMMATHIGFYKTENIEASLLNLNGFIDSVDTANAIQTYIKSEKDIILLPEYSEVFTVKGRDISQEFVNKRLRATGISIDVDDGGNEKWYGTIQIRDNRSHILQSQTKEFLIPTGEYLPYIIRWFFTLTNQQDAIHSFESNRQLTKGSPPEIFEAGDMRIGSIACSGILSREAYRKLVNQGAGVLTNSASLTIFNGSRAYFNQSLMMARFHAVAHQKAFLQATRAAPVFALNYDGSFAFKSPKISSGFHDVSVATSSKKTLYTLMGEWVLVLSFIAMILLVILRIRKR